jgi:hypothetical protein
VKPTIQGDLTHEIEKLSVAVAEKSTPPSSESPNTVTSIPSSITSNASTITPAAPTSSPSTGSTVHGPSSDGDTHTDVTSVPSVAAARPRPAPPVPRKDLPTSPTTFSPPTRPGSTAVAGVLRKKKPGGPTGLKIEPPKAKRTDTTGSLGTSAGLLSGDLSYGGSSNSDDYNPPDSATERGDGSSLMPTGQPLNIPQSTNKIEMSHDDLEEILELGSGNGGTVHKIRYKATSQIMARKVRNRHWANEM